MDTKDLQTINGSKFPTVTDDGEFSGYLDSNKFEHALRVSSMFAKSKMVPMHYQGHQADCMIAFNLAMRLKIDPLLLMQKTYVVHGKMGIETQLAIALVNKSGKFTDVIQYEYTGEKDSRACKAYATTLNGALCEDTCSVQEAKDMGWWTKNPMWSKMTSTFLAYRAAMKMIRKYCPEVLMGMDTQEELKDSQLLNITPEKENIIPLEKITKPSKSKHTFEEPFKKKAEDAQITEKPPAKQTSDKPSLHPVVEKIKKMFEDDAYFTTFDLMEEENSFSKTRVKAIILDNDKDAADILIQEIQAVLAR